MPTYEYRCQECGEHFDVEQRMTDDALTTHDSCGGKLSKVFSSAGIVLKGSGFYKTDTRNSNNAAKASSSKSKTDPKTPEKPKTEKKPEKPANPSK
ncbi:MAG TPA: zinc ribbon domain-containing protein [Acidimicrobiia bacterium]|nr:zinc ribbon domain-containing protein [Acidimicrobiia bacterium]